MGEDLKPILEEIAEQLKRRNDTVDKQMQAADSIRSQMFRSFLPEGEQSENAEPESGSPAFPRFDSSKYMERMGEESDRRMKEIQEQTRISEENRNAFHSQVLAELRRIGDELKRIADRRD